MRALLVLVVVAGTAAADGTRRPAPSKFTAAAGQAFVAALAADDAKDTARALALYRRASAIEPHPTTTYNIAELLQRTGDLDGAVLAYSTYLEQLPTAADRSAVEKLIATLEATPVHLELWSQPTSAEFVDLSTAYVFVDGALVSRPGAKLQKSAEGPFETLQLSVPRGKLAVDVITSLTHAHVDECSHRKSHTAWCGISAPPRIDGRVVFSDARSSGLDNNRPIYMTRDRLLTLAELKPDATQPSFARSRFELPAGKQRVIVSDDPRECAPYTVDVPASAKQVQYVFFKFAARQDRCAYSVITERLTFAQ